MQQDFFLVSLPEGLAAVSAFAFAASATTPSSLATVASAAASAASAAAGSSCAPCSSGERMRRSVVSVVVLSLSPPPPPRVDEARRVDAVEELSEGESDEMAESAAGDAESCCERMEVWGLDGLAQTKKLTNKQMIIH